MSARQEYTKMQQQLKHVKNVIHTSLKGQNQNDSFVKNFLKNMNDKDIDIISDDAEVFILEYIETILIRTVKTACKLSQTRKSPVLEKKDMEFAIQMQLVHRRKNNAVSYISSEMEEIFSKVKEPNQEHLENIALFEKFRQNKREQNQ